MLSETTRKLRDKLVMEHGRAAVFSIINEVVIPKKSPEYDVAVYRMLNEHFNTDWVES